MKPEKIRRNTYDVAKKNSLKSCAYVIKTDKEVSHLPHAFTITYTDSHPVICFLLPDNHHSYISAVFLGNSGSGGSTKWVTDRPTDRQTDIYQLLLLLNIEHKLKSTWHSKRIRKNVKKNPANCNLFSFAFAVPPPPPSLTKVEGQAV